jgi:hypothetical protein
VPFTFLSHQALVLPLKMWRPRWLSGAGLVLGSMAPDFEKFVTGEFAGRAAHTLPGQFLYCLPASIVVYLLLTRVVAGPLARALPALGSFRVAEYAAALAAPRQERWLVFAASVLVGSATHVLWDGATHADPRIVALVPLLAHRAVVIAGWRTDSVTVHQLLASVLGAAFTLWCMYRIGRAHTVRGWAALHGARIDAHRAAPGEVRAYWAVVAAATIALTGGAALASTLASGGWPSTRAFLFSVTLRLPLTGFAALCVAGVLSRRRTAARAAADATEVTTRRTIHHTRSRAS